MKKVHMKFQNPSIHRSKVNTQTDRQTDRQTDTLTDKPKAICPSNFFKVGGIKIDFNVMCKLINVKKCNYCMWLGKVRKSIKYYNRDKQTKLRLNKIYVNSLNTDLQPSYEKQTFFYFFFFNKNCQSSICEV